MLWGVVKKKKVKKMYIKQMVSKMECPKSKSNYKNLIRKFGVNIRNIENAPCLFKYVVMISTSVLFYKRNPKTCHIVFEFFYLSCIYVDIILYLFLNETNSVFMNYICYKFHKFLNIKIQKSFKNQPEHWF